MSRGVNSKNCECEENPGVCGGCNVDLTVPSCNQKEENVVELRVKLQKQRQDHVIALRGKSEEIRVKDKEIASLKAEVDILRLITADNDGLRQELQNEKVTNTELQTELCDINEKLNQHGTLRRDYEASINQVAKLTAERDAIREDREKYYEEGRRLNEYTLELKKQLDNNLRTNAELQQSILTLGHEIQRVTTERNEWKEKYEILNQSNPAEKRHLYKLDKLKFDNEANMPSNGADFRQMSNMQDINRVKRQRVEDSHESLRETHGNKQASVRKQRFSLVPSNLACCKNCGMLFEDGKQMATECRFHRTPPQSYETKSNTKELVWSRMRSNDTVRVNPRLKGHMFWPCCESHGKYKTKGCMSLRHHEIVFPEEE